MLTAKKTTRPFVVAADNEELNRVLDKVRESGPLVMQQGADRFLITRQSGKISEEARQVLLGSGTVDDE